VAPLRRLANSVGGAVGRLSTRGTLVAGELRSAQAPTATPPVWFVFTGAPAAAHAWVQPREKDIRQGVMSSARSRRCMG
jgi:hypothetical protein